MEQKKISQCDTMTVSLDNSYPDAYLAAVNKDNGAFKNFKLSVASLVSTLNNKFAAINSKFTTINNKFTAVNSRIDAIAAGGSSGGGSGSSEDPGEDPGEGGEGSGEEGGGTTPSGQTTDLTEVNNRLQVLENEITNFKNVNNWPVNTIKLTNNAGEVIATYDLPSNYLGRGYTENNSIVIKVNSDASPKYQITVQTTGWNVDQQGNIRLGIQASYVYTSQQQGGTITSLVAQAELRTDTTTLIPANVNLITESTQVSTTQVDVSGAFTSQLTGAQDTVLTATIKIFLDSGVSPIMTLTSVYSGGSQTAAIDTHIVTT